MRQGPRRAGRRLGPSCPSCAVIAPDRTARWCGACGAALHVEATTPTRRVGGTSGNPAPVDTGLHTGPDTGRSRPPRDRGRLLAAGALVAVVGGLLVTQATEESPLVPAGFTVRGDAARTGIVSTDPILEPAGVAWTAQVALPPLTVDGTHMLGTTRVDASAAADIPTVDTGGISAREVAVVLAPATDGQRIAVHDVETGALEWTTMLPLGSQPWDTDLSDGLLAHRTLDSVTLLDLATHQQRWSVPVRLSQASTVTTAGVVGVPADSDRLSLVLLSELDGSQLWRWQAPVDGVIDELRPLGDAVLVEWRDRDEARHLTRVDLMTGDTGWDLLLATVVNPISFPSPGLAIDQDLALLTRAEGSALIDLRDGSIVLLPAIPGPTVGSALTHTDGQPLAVVYDGFGRVTAFDGDGIRWSIQHTRSPIFGLTLAGDVIALRGDGDITLLSLDNGGVIGRLTLPSSSLGDVELTEDGTVLVLDNDATLEAYAVTGARWKAPTIAAHLPDIVTSEGALAITIPTGVEVRDVIDGTRRFAHDAFDVGLVRAGTLTAPALARGRVIVAPAGTQPANRGGMMALFADAGTTSWARDDDRMPVRGTPVVFDDLAVLAVGSQLHGYRLRDGTRRLVMETSAPREHVAVAGDTIVATDLALNAGDVWGGRPSDGTRRFRIEVRTCAPPTIVEDRFLIATDEGDIFARSVDDGEAVWGERAGGSACRPFSIAGQTAVSMVDDRMLVGIALDSGATTWRAELGATAAAAPVVAGETLLVPTMAGTLEAWDIGAEAPTWTVELGGVAAGAVAVEDGTIMVLLRDGRLVGLR